MAKASFQVTATVIDKLLAPANSFIVPEFQRHFAWTKDEVSEFVDDIFDSETLPVSGATESPYFIGSLVLASTSSEQELIVLDGQQRLTTTSLLIACLRDSLHLAGHKQASHLHQYLEGGRFGEPQKPKLRLQPSDLVAYQGLIGAPSATSQSVPKHALSRAVQQIQSGIKKHCARLIERGLTEPQSLERLVKRLLEKVEVVCITAPTEAAAFRLFEALNDRGLPLNAADLVKNKLFAQCSHSLEEARVLWQSICEATGPSELIHFLRYYWLAFQGPVRKNGLYDVLGKHIADKNPADALGFAHELSRAASLYRELARPSADRCPWGSDTADTLQRLNVLRARSCRPALLLCASKQKELLPAVAAACESITVRVAVSDLNPNLMEKAYADLCSTLQANGTTNALTELYTAFSKLVPDDEQFRNSFARFEVSSQTAIARELLMKLNSVLGTGETRPDPSRLHLEHVLPQVPSREAILESEVSENEAADLVDLIGNVTLLSGKKNQQISNGPFTRKQAVFETSEIALNEWISSQSCWTAATIRSRGDFLADLAVRAWPWPV